MATDAPGETRRFSGMEMRVGVGIKQENKADLNHKFRIGDVSSISLNTGLLSLAQLRS